MFLAAISLLSILTILPYFYFAVFLFCGITEICGCNVPLVWGAVWRILRIRGTRLPLWCSIGLGWKLVWGLISY